MLSLFTRRWSIFDDGPTLRAFNPVYNYSLQVIVYIRSRQCRSWSAAVLFSSNPNQTHLNKLIKVFRITRAIGRWVFFRVGAKLCRTSALQDRRCLPLVYVQYISKMSLILTKKKTWYTMHNLQTQATILLKSEFVITQSWRRVINERGVAEGYGRGLREGLGACSVRTPHLL